MEDKIIYSKDEVLVLIQQACMCQKFIDASTCGMVLIPIDGEEPNIDAALGYLVDIRNNIATGKTFEMILEMLDD